MTWHERLEIFCPLTGRGTFRIGEHIESFEAGDILLIDNLRLHGVNSFEGLRRHALVIVFTPDLLAAPGALPCDLWLLRPFHHLEHRCLHLPWEGEHLGAAWDCLTRLLLEELEGTTGPARQVRQKFALAELLIVLQQALQDRIAAHNEYESRASAAAHAAVRYAGRTPRYSSWGARRGSLSGHESQLLHALLPYRCRADILGVRRPPPSDSRVPAADRKRRFAGADRG